MEEELIPYKIILSKFLGCNDYGHCTYELTFNQSIVHTGRWKGIEDGLNAYRENEIKEEEKKVLKKADLIREKYGMPSLQSNKEVQGSVINKSL